MIRFMTNRKSTTKTLHKKGMKKYFINESHKEFLLQEVPALSNQPDRVVSWITYLLFNIASGRGIKHCYEQDKAFISYSVIREFFPKNTGNFVRLNEQTGLFNISRNWYSGRGHGKTYEVTEKGRQIVDKYHALNARKPDLNLRFSIVDQDGKPMRKPRVAIAKKDSNGEDRASTGKLKSSTVTINTGGVYQLLDEINRDMQQPDNDSRFYRGVALAKEERIIRLSEYNQQGIACIENASLPNLKPGQMIQTYHEARSGRLVGNGFHLQGIRREIRDAALAGQWDYDISNCHYTFMHSLGTGYGCDMPATKYYLKNKKDFRRLLSDEYGISEEMVKKIITAMLYGSPLTLSPFNTIGKILADTDGEKFLAQPDIREMEKEIRNAQTEILNNAERGGGLIRNVMGKTCPITEKKDTQLAHILHGYEALAMDIAINTLEGEITLLCFDGFIVPEKIAAGSISRKFYSLTGIDIEYEHKEITKAA